MSAELEQLLLKLDSLRLWEAVAPYQWAFKLCGVAYPYFFSLHAGDGKPVRWRLRLLEGWQTLHDFLLTGRDHDYGFASAPFEFSQFEFDFLADGKVAAFRHDPGYAPRVLDAAADALVQRLLREALGVMLRIETDRQLPFKFATDRAMFARLEKSPGEWSDEPLEIPPPAPHTETIKLSRERLKLAADLPFLTDWHLALDFRLEPGVATQERRPRSAYRLLAVDRASREVVIDELVSVQPPDIALRELWEGIAPRLLEHLLRLKRIPGEIHVASGRVFRMLRPLGEELPFKLQLHDRLEELDVRPPLPKDSRPNPPGS